MPGQLKPATKVSGTLKEMLNDVIEQAQKEAHVTTAFMFKRLLEDENGVTATLLAGEKRSRKGTRQ
jgi:hypothetical protein